MLKTRLIATLVIKGGMVVQSFNFERYLPIGKPKFSVEFLSKWDIDEIVILDIDASINQTDPDYRMIELISNSTFIPLTVGGGINSSEVAKKVIDSGADKITINTHALKSPDLISDIACELGNQSVVVSIDAKKNQKNQYEVYSFSKVESIYKDVLIWSKKCEDLGAGEIFLNSVDNDGMRLGYDTDLLLKISSNLSIPLIACGGIGSFTHFYQGVVLGGASGVAAGNIFHHIEHSSIIAKANLILKHQNVRMEMNPSYNNFWFDESGRPININ
jgi:imidazole glycerol-phosphate synthase subunit HisF